MKLNLAQGEITGKVKLEMKMVKMKMTTTTRALTVASVTIAMKKAWTYSCAEWRLLTKGDGIGRLVMFPCIALMEVVIW